MPLDFGLGWVLVRQSLAGVPLVAVGALALVAGGPGCADSGTDRYAQQRSTTIASFGEDERLRVEVEPGLAICAVAENVAVDPATASVSDLCSLPGETSDRNVVVVRAAAPFPEIYLDNGTARRQTVRLRISNLPALAVETPLLTPLRSGARRNPTCTKSGTGSSSVYLAPVAATALDAVSRLVELSLPACRTIRLSEQLDPDATAFRIAVVGPAPVSDGFIGGALLQAEAWGADYVQFLGDVFQPGAAEPAARFLSLVEPSDPTSAAAPYGILMGSQERAAGASAFYERYGPTDFVSRVGRARLLSLDTSLGLLSSGQLDFVTGLPAVTPTLAFLHDSPWVPDSYTATGFRDLEGAAALAEALQSAAVRDVLATSDHGGTRTLGQATLRVLADPASPKLGNDPTYAQVTVEAPWPPAPACRDGACDDGSGCLSDSCLPLCRTDLDCAAERPTCDAGLCRTRCSGDADCSAAAPFCGDDGRCLESPRIRVELLHLE